MSHSLQSGAANIFQATVLRLLLWCVAALCLCATLSAQTPQIPQQSNGGSMNPGQTQPGPRSNPQTPPEQENSAVMQVQSGSYALTGQQIFALLETKPEVVVELKQLTADQLQQQGLHIQADSISDEALYMQIGSSQLLRIGITNYLHARGYITDQDIQRGEPIGIQTMRLPGQTTRFAENDDSEDPAVALRNLQALSQFSGASLRLGPDDEIAEPEATGLSPNLAQLTTERSPNAASAANTLQPPMRNSQPAEPPRDMAAHNTTDAPEVLRQPAPYNLRSLRDLYTQIPELTVPLKRFGSEVFIRRTATQTQRSVSANTMLPVLSQAPMENTPLDIPIGPDYVVGPGDSLTIDLWGGIAQTLTARNRSRRSHFVAGVWGRRGRRPDTWPPRRR